jgi:lysophospholipid hydrolase
VLPHTLSADADCKVEHMRVHKRGPIWKYVRASMTLTSFLPPIYDNGELLVDGGYVNNLPADVMASLGVNTIIGVDVEDKSNALAPDKICKLEGHVSGWYVLWRYVVETLGFGGGKTMPSHKDLTTALCYIAHTAQFPRQRAMLDLKLEPPCADIGETWH